MAKYIGNIECFNDGHGIKHILGEDLSSLCGDEKVVLVRNYYGRKDYVLRRSIEAITCSKCKSLYEQN